jgi:sporadic carbohydrate cluster protein (TIGR04323 family)
MGLKVVGYIASDLLRSSFTPQQTQNFNIKLFLESSGHDFLLSWAEHKGSAPFVLRSLMEERFFDGVCFYSIEQLNALENPFDWIELFASRNYWIGFAREGISFQGDVGRHKIERFSWMKRNLEGTRPDLASIWPGHV